MGISNPTSDATQWTYRHDDSLINKVFIQDIHSEVPGNLRHRINIPRSMFACPTFVCPTPALPKA